MNLLDLRQLLPDGCISDLTFDEWRAFELSDAEVARLEAHVAACERCRTRRTQLDAKAARFLERFPDFEPGARQARAARPTSKKLPAAARRTWLWAAASGLGALAAAAGLLLLVQQQTASDAPSSAEFSTRLKGGSRIGFFVKRGAQVFEGVEGQPVKPGDQLRFTVTTTGSKFVAILSLDGAGVASVYYPDAPESMPLSTVHEHGLDSSVKLDATLGEERLFGVFCEKPFDVAALRANLERHQQLPPLQGCSVDTLNIIKEAL